MTNTTFQVNDLIQLENLSVSRITKITDMRIELEGSHSSFSVPLEEQLKRAPIYTGGYVRLVRGSAGNSWVVASTEGASVKLRSQTLSSGTGLFAPRYLECALADVVAVADRDTILNDLVTQSRVQAAKTAHVPTAPSLSVEKERAKYKHDFANLPTEYNLRGHMCMMTDPRFSYLMENVSFWIDYYDLGLTEEAEALLKSGEVIGWIHEEPHALRVHIQGCGSEVVESCIKEFQDLLVKFLIPSVYVGDGTFLLEQKWKKAR